MLMKTKIQHSAVLVMIYVRCDIHYWKWIKQIIQSTNCVLAWPLKHRNECFETNERRFESLTWNIVIYQDDNCYSDWNQE